MICMMNPIQIYLTADDSVVIEEPPEEHVPIEEHTLWKAINLYVSREAKSEDTSSRDNSMRMVGNPSYEK